jgi:hypothetical protein
LNDIQKEFFFVKLMILHKNVFNAPSDIKIEDLFCNKYSHNTEENKSTESTTGTHKKFTRNLLLFKEMLSIPTLLQNEKL